MATTYSRNDGFFDYVSNSSNQIDYDYDKIIDYDDTGSRWDISAFLMRKENSEKVGSPEFYTWEGEYQTRQVTVNGAITTSETTLTVDATDGVRVGDLLHIATADEDGQHVRVTAINSLDLTVERLGTKAPIADDATALILLEAASETASTSVPASFVYPNRVTNRVMIARRAFEWSLTEDATDLRTEGSSSKEKARQAKVEFQKDMAHLAWASLSTSSATTGVITSKGILPQLAGNSSSNRTNAQNDVLSYDDLVNLADGLLEFSDTREYMVFCGSNALMGLAKLGTSSGTYRSTPDDNIYGFAGQAAQVGDIKFMFKFERVFKELGSPYNAYAVALSLKNIKFAHLGAKGKFQIQNNVHDDPGGETRKTQLRAQVGVKMHNTKRHGYVFNLAA